MTLTPRMTELFSLLSEIAERGEVCPRNAELAEMLGTGSFHNVSTWIVGLEKAGMIEVHRIGFERIVTIVATGKKTEVPDSQRIARIQRYQTTHKAMAVARGVQIVDRDPCWKCGVRGDIGCSHKPRSSPVPLSEAGRV